jgi:hypothetical protein
VSSLHGRPSATELVATVRDLLVDLLDARAAEQTYQIRVAIRALDMVERELGSAGEDEEASAARLAHLGFRDEGDLATAIRRGAVPASLDAEVRRAVQADVEARLRVTDPEYVHRHDRQS